MQVPAPEKEKIETKQERIKRLECLTKKLVKGTKAEINVKKKSTRIADLNERGALITRLKGVHAKFKDKAELDQYIKKEEQQLSTDYNTYLEQLRSAIQDPSNLETVKQDCAQLKEVFKLVSAYTTQLREIEKIEQGIKEIEDVEREKKQLKTEEVEYIKTLQRQLEDPERLEFVKTEYEHLKKNGYHTHEDSDVRKTYKELEEQIKTKEQTKLRRKNAVVIHFEKQLGRGGFGTVYEATDNGQTIAVKELKKHTRQDNEECVNNTQRFLGSDFLGTFEKDGKLYLMMQKYGTDLCSAIKGQETFNRIAVAKAVNKQLKAAHDAKFVHGDVKIDNVLLAPNKEAKLVDWDTAKEVSKCFHSPSFRCPTFNYTEKYQAKEVKENRIEAATATKLDTYSYGCMLEQLTIGLGNTEASNKLMALGRKCKDDNPVKRPSEADIELELEQIAKGAKREIKNQIQKCRENIEILKDHLDRWEEVINRVIEYINKYAENMGCNEFIEEIKELKQTLKLKVRQSEEDKTKAIVEAEAKAQKEKNRAEQEAYQQIIKELTECLNHPELLGTVIETFKGISSQISSKGDHVTKHKMRELHASILSKWQEIEIKKKEEKRKKEGQRIAEEQQIKKMSRNIGVEIKEKIGHGSYGTVYSASYKGQTYAVKTLKLSRASEYEEAKKEIEYLVKYGGGMFKGYYVDRATNPQWVCIMMEKMDSDLWGVLHNQNQRLYPIDIKINYLKQVAEQLANVHASGDQHRDLKPGNILVKDDKARLADWGAAKSVASAFKGEECVNEACETTYQYAAEEALDPMKKTGAKSDVYSFGVIIWEMLNPGKNPYYKGTTNETTAKEYLQKIQNGEKFVGFQNYTPNTPSERKLYELAKVCMSKEPGDRPTIREVERKLQEIATQSKQRRAADTQTTGAYTAEQITKGISNDVAAMKRRIASSRAALKVQTQTLGKMPTTRVVAVH
ncbi:MAG: protein kinase [bacterium]